MLVTHEAAKRERTACVTRRLNMPPSELPTLEELEKTHNELSEKIKEAQKLSDSESKELSVLKNGLKHIEKMIAELRARNGHQ
jgi:DNA gyrase/topoisomerase IV subunit A